MFAGWTEQRQQLRSVFRLSINKTTCPHRELWVNVKLNALTLAATAKLARLVTIVNGKLIMKFQPPPCVKRHFRGIEQLTTLSWHYDCYETRYTDWLVILYRQLALNGQKDANSWHDLSFSFHWVLFLSRCEDTLRVFMGSWLGLPLMIVCMFDKLLIYRFLVEEQPQPQIYEINRLTKQKKAVTLTLTLQFNIWKSETRALAIFTF